MQPLTSLLALAALASAATVSINVGEVGISFDPDSATAAVGDTLEFHFYTGTGPHSVVHAAFANPCVPGPDAFFSGLMAGNEDGSEVFTVPVTSKDPIWFYCSASKHCQNGMVGVVNPPSNGTVDDFAAAAKGVSQASAPASATGGTSTSIAAGSSTASSKSSAARSAGSTTGAASSGASSVGSSASAAASSPGAARRNDGNAAAGLAAVAGGLVAMLA